MEISVIESSISYLCCICCIFFLVIIIACPVSAKQLMCAELVVLRKWFIVWSSPTVSVSVCPCVFASVNFICAYWSHFDIRDIYTTTWITSNYDMNHIGVLAYETTPCHDDGTAFKPHTVYICGHNYKKKDIWRIQWVSEWVCVCTVHAYECTKCTSILNSFQFKVQTVRACMLRE